MKKLKAERAEVKREKELEIKYGITNKVEFDFKCWFKKNYFKELKAFEKRLNLEFNDEKILISAFTHASFRNEIGALTVLAASEDTSSSDIPHRLQITQQLSSDLTSEKLSLLGFEAASSIIKSHLYNRYRSLTPSVSNDVWRFLISRQVITDLAQNIGLEDFILISREFESMDKEIDEEVHLDITKDDILGDAFFALLGAIEMDLGHNETKYFIEDFILPHLDHTDLTEHVEMNDPHEELLKILSLQGINYSVKARTLIETGVDSHFPFYQVGIFCRGKQIGEGSGHSTSIARKNAFKSTVFHSLENEVDFNELKRKN